jgi:hypothetical protein
MLSAEESSTKERSDILNPGSTFDCDVRNLASIARHVALNEIDIAKRFSFIISIRGSQLKITLNDPSTPLAVWDP